MLGRGAQANSKFPPDMTSPRKEHWNSSLIVAIAGPVRGDEVFLLKVGAENEPGSPQHIEEETVCTHDRCRPDEHEHAEVKRVPDPEIGAANSELRLRPLFAIKVSRNGNPPKRIESFERPNAPH